jgi:hypothetical protein
MRTAESKGLNKGLWGFIGAASYYGPLLLFGYGIAPILIENGTLEFDSLQSAQISLVAMNIAVGITCCVIAYQILKNQPVQEVENEEVIDVL